MKISKDNKRPNIKAKDLKRSSANILLNVIIIILSLFIIYMSYSIYIKMSKKDAQIEPEVKNQTMSEIIQVEVLNGSGFPDLTDKAADFLRLKKFDVVSKGNYESFDVLETLIIDRSGNKANAEAVAKALGVKTKIIQQINSNYLLDVSIVIGKDYFNLEAFK